MGICGSSDNGLTWEERWYSPAYRKTLQEFCSEERKEDEDSDESTSIKVLRGVSKDGEFRNWAATVQTAPAKVFRPRSTEEVQILLAKARTETPMPKIRCMGSGHSWTPLFADDGAWLIDTSDMKDLVWSADENPTQVTIGPGVTPAQLATFFDSKSRGKWRGLFLSSDVVLGTVTYGGTINTACHGTGKTQTLPDYVVSTSFIKSDGTHVTLNRKDDPERFALQIIHFGLLGITTAFTLQLDHDTYAIKVTDSKLRARNVFLEKDQLPTPGGPNPLLDLWNRTYGVEIFYFAASSLKITNLHSHEFEDQDWDQYSDICAIKTFDRTENATGKDDDSFFGKDSKTSTRFDRNFSITDFLKINVGTEVALPLVAKVGSKPALVSLYAKVAALAFEPAGDVTGEVSYETSLGQAIHWQKYITSGFPVSDTEVCIKCDPDFTSVYKAIHDAIGIMRSFAEDEDTLPINVAMELRFTKHSDSPLSPAYGTEGDVFCWLEVLSAVNTPRLKHFNTKVADLWLAIKLKDGSRATRPHWAKFSESYVSDANSKLKEAYADRLPLLQAVSKEFDPNRTFVNDYFAQLFAP